MEKMLGKILGTHWELERNIVRTHWEAGKNEKKILPPLHPPNIKGKKAGHLECMLGPSHWLHEISLPKRLWHHFLQRTPHLFSVGAHLILKNNCRFFKHFKSREPFCKCFIIQAFQMTKLGW
jgi:hypothetical protein